MFDAIKEILLILVLAYIAFGVILFVLQRKMTYYPNNQDFFSCKGFEDSEKLDLGGTRAYFKKSSDRVIVFYHGNAGSTCDRDFLKDDFESRGVSYLFVEYAGYSGDDKNPSEKLLKKDVENVVEFLKEEEFLEVIVAGGSIGSSLAIYHSTLGEVDSLFLISPFYRLSDMAKSVYGMYPVSLMMIEKYESNEWIQETSAKKLRIIHGSDDEIIPISQSKKLFKEASIKDKKFFEVKGAHHNDIYGFEETWKFMRESVSR
jgi:esterase/lipase